ncbi:50S ribosome-binding GTPase [Clostridium sp. FP1]|uniref:50S ribosome-binding GTPase n=1 Tax=Clostridium sp. FP1 TaxID=2724076 RepID=UPI0013E968BE|nr:50S ribosome-binding GTPase [Clostridium sp. FP1]MBZ9633334.1 50S ribosome-binding GTPase [Clostridium sp. FP1]
MGYRCFDKKVEIAIVGISNSGKSTFIGSLFDNLTREILRKISIENKGKGQTKIPVHYNLDKNFSEDRLVLENIKWNEELIQKALESDDEKFQEICKACNQLGLKCNDFKGEHELNEKLIEIQNRIADNLMIEELFETYINNIGIYNTGIINSIMLKGKPSPTVLRYMDKFEFESVVLRDTKGLLDEEFDKLFEKRSLEIEKEKNTSEDKYKLLAERGLIGVNACILMNGPNTGIPDGVKALYSSIFEIVANKMPTFLVERSSNLNEKILQMLDDDDELTEETYINLLKNKSISRYSFKNMDRTLEAFGKNDGTISQELVKRNYQRFLLSDIADSLEMPCENKEAVIEYEKSYIFTVKMVIKQLLESLSNLRDTIREASEVFGNNKKKILEAFIESYKLYFLDNIALFNNKKYDCRIVLYRYCESIAKKVLSYNSFSGYSGMLGVRGGLTYSLDKKVDSISLLKSGKVIIDTILTEFVSNGTIAQPLIKCINEIFIDDLQVRMAIGNIYILLNNYLDNGYSEELITDGIGRIIDRTNLKVACDHVRNEKIGTTSYYSIFKKYSAGRNELSVVYGILRILLYNFIDSLDTSSISSDIFDEMLNVK